ncbi:uncharacterized protein LOC135398265 [Ornithodoros turicata]|uniref:uncharacterized protein LOC135398265 n=1 Tax=Ornithodoros turicata TaxID=34597 RepID=UPI003138A801
MRVSTSSLVVITLSLMTLSPSTSYPWTERVPAEYGDYGTTATIATSAETTLGRTSPAPFHPRIEPASTCGADVSKTVEKVERALQTLPAIKNLGMRSEVLGISIHNETMEGLDNLRPDRPVMNFCRDGEQVVKLSLAPTATYRRVALKLHYGTYYESYIEITAGRLRVEVDFAEWPYWGGKEVPRVDSVNAVEVEDIELRFGNSDIGRWLEPMANLILYDGIRSLYTDRLQNELFSELYEALR